MHRRRFLLAAATLAALPRAALASPGMPNIVTWRDTGCSCCEGWVAAARAAGYTVQIREIDHAARMRKYGLADGLNASCHTAVVGGYLVEGHVPMDVLAKLLRERPKTRGIAVPGMPSGLPGMPGPKTAPVAVITLDAPPRVYATV